MTMQETVSGACLREFSTRQEAARSLAQRIKQALLFELEQMKGRLWFSVVAVRQSNVFEFFRPSVCPGIELTSL